MTSAHRCKIKPFFKTCVFFQNWLLLKNENLKFCFQILKVWRLLYIIDGFFMNTYFQYGVIKSFCHYGPSHKLRKFLFLHKVWQTYSLLCMISKLIMKSMVMPFHKNIFRWTLITFELKQIVGSVFRLWKAFMRNRILDKVPNIQDLVLMLWTL